MAFECDVITLFPEMFNAITQYGVTGKANRNDFFRLNTWNPRDFTHDKHRTVDDSPYGGGPGMVMMAQPLEDAITQAKARQNALGIEKTQTLYLTPQGKRLDHEMVKELSTLPGLILLCGRYEGIDERLIMSEVDMEISIGDYVVSGGELAAMILIDCIVRQIPGTLGHPESANQDSFADGLLDYPHYTRPELYKGSSVPEVLMSGNHAHIRRWRLQQALGRTWLKRPDLFELKFAHGMTIEEEKLLEEFKQSCKSR
ncbi:MAG: tRNA (guanosine(37)-N1)-methyltransferase TrmD [Nitrosomonas sp.]|jgi:tRNA (guanine37-N1)-methyltransferase|uniref:tRNA (guanosine(37)-N1)-methyltransferase TrmD n=1 Tax=Nitrosomonas sp. TaxID=42353 RepID=UPI0027270270|nr:tRNA (guanosine(37)-N1)-methyltransferase TrmD [Nitrosomonas sp.]MBK6957447.1 tRNA (guanosine(37)-N1)-methyltransferase TrmD [Nitrosomonas sp.]MDO9469676.1 tRNA (guanosine(37)-N1)-methyltransferase TrmD [Nitrosomonas sp.]MDP1549366.1 tRNA (guanosine(37)-N1)-methyltransferase TrmD [Nitrosomonas sp.]MDP1788017.1 tRNA (guanosine(37)-N1)-methyltransferase TrmD [Nitrosomonas sp.]MDP1933925.1 tRNA (guanosine(37)-N1)-methyltransferase TrmD [Nitrosomonas sp.]